MDFTLDVYKKFLATLNSDKSRFCSFSDFIERKNSISYLQEKRRIVILRHDVDLLPQSSLRFAQIQAEMGIKGSYYFRAVPESWDENIIKEIASLGHEVGYHYENMDTCNGDIHKAWDDFRYNLDKLKKLVEVKTICMHGSPRSKYDNRDIWGKYDYKSLGISGEPYYDVNFDKVFYLTDTGRRWDGWKTSVRDKVPQQDEWIKRGLVFHSTQDIIKAVENLQIEQPLRRKGTLQSITTPSAAGTFPNQIMFTMHPQRWHNGGYSWLKEYLYQALKNQIKKRFIVKSSTNYKMSKV
jgi:hypothetical protein